MVTESTYECPPLCAYNTDSQLAEFIPGDTARCLANVASSKCELLDLPGLSTLAAGATGEFTGQTYVNHTDNATYVNGDVQTYEIDVNGLIAWPLAPADRRCLDPLLGVDRLIGYASYNNFTEVLSACSTLNPDSYGYAQRCHVRDTEDNCIEPGKPDFATALVDEHNAYNAVDWLPYKFSAFAPAMGSLPSTRHMDLLYFFGIVFIYYQITSSVVSAVGDVLSGHEVLGSGSDSATVLSGSGVGVFGRVLANYDFSMRNVEAIR